MPVRRSGPTDGERNDDGGSHHGRYEGHRPRDCPTIRQTGRRHLHGLQARRRLRRLGKRRDCGPGRPTACDQIGRQHARRRPRAAVQGRRGRRPARCRGAWRSQGARRTDSRLRPRRVRRSDNAERDVVGLSRASRAAAPEAGKQRYLPLQPRQPPDRPSLRRHRGRQGACRGARALSRAGTRAAWRAHQLRRARHAGHRGGAGSFRRGDGRLPRERSRRQS